MELFLPPYLIGNSKRPLLRGRWSVRSATTIGLPASFQDWQIAVHWLQQHTWSRLQTRTGNFVDIIYNEIVWIGNPSLLLILMLWHRQAVFESKGDKLFSSAEFRIRTQGLWNRISSRLKARWQTDWAIEDQAKNLNSIARPYDQRAFSPLDQTVGWLSHLTLVFVVVNFDALAQASNFRIERRQVKFICWMQDSNPGFLEPNLQPTECPLINTYGNRYEITLTE